MKETIQEAIAFATENWDNLPKAETDNEEFVMIAENNRSGNYETDQECLGVRKDGTLIWVYVSGCSCQGHAEVCEDITTKTFRIQGIETVEEFYRDFKCEPHTENYKSY